MKGFVFWGAFLTSSASQVQAGHGKIKDTELQNFVEYYGDFSDMDNSFGISQHQFGSSDNDDLLQLNEFTSMKVNS